MKKILFPLITLLFLAGCGTAPAAENLPSAAEAPSTETDTLVPSEEEAENEKICGILMPIMVS